MSSQYPQSSNRRYVSPRRRQQANETRARIADAARRLIARQGYAATTIAEIAQAAGVAPQTVYASFGGKRGILEMLVERAVFGVQYEKLVERVFDEKDPASRLRFAAQIAGKIYEADRGELAFLRKSGVPEAELIALHRDERQRFSAQSAMIDLLAADRAFRAGIDRRAAHDILWALTGRDLYRLLVLERGWSAARYQRWLAELLVKELIGAKPTRRRSLPT